jgi:mRNA interferase YafQ
MQRRGKNESKLWKVIEALQNGEELAVRYRNHQLSGNLEGVWDCHIEPDWLLLYLLTSSEVILLRTGSHSDIMRPL